MMQEALIDCSQGTTTVVALSPADQSVLAAAQTQARAQDQARAAAQAFHQMQQTALAGVAPLLHGAQAAPDAAALAALVHKLTSDPPQPLSAPETSTLARFLLRCLLP